MTANHSLLAADPYTNATVTASAGCGKTWLLVTRMVRLLLEGAEPGSLLALTFTRKAAAEMSIRLNERLYEMAIANDTKLDTLLLNIGSEANIEIKAIARGLYGKCLHALNPVRVQTFHAFCQDLLSHFPLEADIPPGFELKEETGQLEKQAWDTLFSDATKYPDGTLAIHLDTLMQAFNGPANTLSALSSFLRQRNDWWAYTELQTNPVEYASKRLQEQLNIDESTNPIGLFNDTVSIESLTEFSILLGKHKTKANENHVTLLSSLLLDDVSEEQRFNQVQDIFLTQSKQPRARKQSKTQQKNMGEENELRFLKLHDDICQKLLTCLDLEKRCNALRLNTAWYEAGHAYITNFQKIKRELRVLDFSDLEWKCYQLLNTSDNALWVQYKIDQRIDHFLIDEFQDTNPTQWQLLKPLLEEFAANPNERWRSVFLVGDPKQSIYSFRRANPKLQSEAISWLQLNLSAQETPLDSSRRSSPAIIDFVNQLFSQESIQPHFPDFMTHDTHLNKLPGSVCLLPLCIEKELKDDTDEVLKTELRNPLLEPRNETFVEARNNEAQQIAEKINDLTTSSLIIEKTGEAETTRHVQYGDIMILMRSRTHSHIYEKALQQNNIPYISNQQGSFLDNLEISDLEKLLDSLITPFNNLAIAQVLKSPIFSATDDDLILLAQTDNSKPWFQRLSIVAEQYPDSHALIRAEKMLRHWRELADTIPVHDLLDRIFFEGNILTRYSTAVSDSKKAQVKANLQKFLELSLELNSGRYPSLSRFLDYLRSFRQSFAKAPDEPTVAESGNCVRLMTIHASKGLESPVVFLIDSDNTNSGNDAYSAMVYWPISHQQPTHFQLLTNKQNIDSVTNKVLQQKTLAPQQENLNLLYVATTRARQYLFISGTEKTKNNKESWYPLVKNAMESISEPDQNGVLQYTYNSDENEQLQSAPNNSNASEDLENDVEHKSTTKIKQELTKPIPYVQLKNRLISPSLLNNKDQVVLEKTHEEGRERGIIIHRALELLLGSKELSQNNLSDNDLSGNDLSIEEITHQIIQENTTMSVSDVNECVNEAFENYNNPNLADIFHPDENTESYSELPLLFQSNNKPVYGIIDRLVIKHNEILLIDYKSHQCEQQSDLEKLADSFKEQMQYYKTGVALIWPSHNIKTGLLFTHCKRLAWLEV